jgi:hypothetical protein
MSSASKTYEIIKRGTRYYVALASDPMLPDTAQSPGFKRRKDAAARIRELEYIPAEYREVR